MNTLQLIKKQINKASAIHDAQILTPHIVVLSVKFVKHLRRLTAPSAIAVVLHQMRQSWKHYKSQD